MDSCECHAQFCYTCGSVWKTCNCNVFALDVVNVAERILPAELEQAMTNTDRLRMEYVRIQAAREEAYQIYTNISQTLHEARQAGQEQPLATLVALHGALHQAIRRYLDTAREAHRARYRLHAAQDLLDDLIALA